MLLGCRLVLFIRCYAQFTSSGPDPCLQHRDEIYDERLRRDGLFHARHCQSGEQTHQEAREDPQPTRCCTPHPPTPRTRDRGIAVCEEGSRISTVVGANPLTCWLGVRPHPRHPRAPRAPRAPTPALRTHQFRQVPGDADELG